jgi:hypothetical protein
MPSYTIETVRCASCENEARYIDAHGDLSCALCPIKFGIDSIRIVDVPALLAWSREVLAGGFMGGDSFGKLREIVGQQPVTHEEQRQKNVFGMFIEHFSGSEESKK